MHINKVTKAIIAVVVGFSILFTAVVGTFIVYNYKQLNRLFQTWYLVKGVYLEKVDNGSLIDGAAKGIVSSLNDPYSVFMDAKEYKHLTEQIEGSFSGVGLFVEMKEGNKLAVLSPIEGGPAGRAGIQSGDVIIKINDEDTSNMNLDIAVSKMKGPQGSEVNVTVFRESANKILDFKLLREKISVPTVVADIIPNEPDIGYLKLNQFTPHSSEEVEKGINDLKKKGAKKLVFDLRDNPGGELNAAIDIASLFIPAGTPVVHIVDKSGEMETQTTTRPNINIPFVVLVNGNSASASEVVSGAIKDTGAGPLIGTTTFGKGIVQTLMQMGDGYGIKLTTAKYLTPLKNDIHKKGIQPDVAVDVPKEQTSPKKLGEADPILAKGIEILKKK